MRVLLTDGNQRATLAAARSLVAAGYEVHVAAPGRWSLAGVSRGVHAWPCAPDPLEDPAAFAATIGRLAGGLGARVVVPMTDESAEAVLEHRRSLPEEVALPFTNLATWRFAADKRAMLPRALAAGFAVPDTLVLETPDDEIVSDPTLYPAVLKPHASVVTDRTGRRCKLAVSFVSSAAACRVALTALPAAAFPVLLQRPVRGPGEGVFMLRWNGRIVAAFAHRRLRETPVAGGVSTYRESIPLDPTIAAAARRLLDDLDWQGVAMVELKRESESGRAVFMEVNGRFWGSLQLAIDAGADFPSLLMCCALGRPVPPAVAYQSGVRLRWWWGEIDHLYQRLRRAGPETGSRRSAVAAFLGSFQAGRDRGEVWRWRDPVPFLVETVQWLARTMGLGRLPKAIGPRAVRRRRPASAPTPAAAIAPNPPVAPLPLRTRPERRSGATAPARVGSGV